MNEEDKEILELVERYEAMLSRGEKSWFDSMDLVDIIDYYDYEDETNKWREVINRAYKMFPNDEQIVIRKATLYISDEEYSKAKKLVLPFIKAHPSNELKGILATIYMQENDSDLDKAENILKDLILDEQDNIHYIYQLSAIKIDKGEYEEAEILLRDIILENSGDETLLFSYVTCAVNEEIRNNIIHTLQTIVNKKPFENIVWLYLAKLYLHADEIDKASECVDYVLAIDTEDAAEQVHTLKASIAFAKQDTETFVKESLLASNYSSEPYFYYERIAKMYSQVQEYRKAIEYYQKSLEFEKTGESLPKSNFGIIECFLLTDNYNMAIKYLDRAMAFNYDTEYYIDFATRLYALGFAQLSEEIFWNFIDDEDERISVIATIALAYLKAEDDELLAGIRILEDAIGNNKISDDIYLAMLDLSCRDDRYVTYSRNALKHIITKKDFREEIEKNYPNLLDNKNYIKYLKELLDE